MKPVELAVHMQFLQDKNFPAKMMELREAAAIDVLDIYRSKIAAHDKLMEGAKGILTPEYGLRRPPTPQRRREAAAFAQGAAPASEAEPAVQPVAFVDPEAAYPPVEAEPAYPAAASEVERSQQAQGEALVGPLTRAFESTSVSEQE